MSNINFNNNVNAANLNRIVGGGKVNSPKGSEKSLTTIGADFGTLLQEQLDRNSGVDKSKLQFSKHAKERIAQRGIDISPELLEELNNALKKADKKGAKDVVIFDSMNAFIVNVPNKTVVTTMSGNEMRENVFTNIDGAIIL